MTHLVPVLRPVLGSPFRRAGLYRAAGEIPSWHIAPVRTGTVTDLISGSQIITFTNSSPAMGFNSSGILVQPAANVPFIEYDPATGSALGWRIWGAVVNLGLHSRDLTQAAWVASGITPTRDQVGADATANTGTRLTATASDGTILQTITSASATRVSGFLIKRLTGTGVIQITQDGGATWNTVTITNQWLRYAIAAATVTNPQIGFRVRSSGDEIAVDFAQLQSSSVLGPPVPTTSLTASSTADVASITGAAFAGIYNSTEATLFARWSSTANATQRCIFDVEQAASSSDRVDININTANVINPRTVVSGAAVASLAGGTYTANTIGAIAFGYRAGDYASSFNGASVVTDATAGSLPASPARLFIGSLNGLNYLNGYVREMATFKSRRPNANLQSMTQ